MSWSTYDEIEAASLNISKGYIPVVAGSRCQFHGGGNLARQCSDSKIKRISFRSYVKGFDAPQERNSFRYSDSPVRKSGASLSLSRSNQSM